MRTLNDNLSTLGGIFIGISDITPRFWDDYETHGIVDFRFALPGIGAIPPGRAGDNEANKSFI